MLSACSSHTNSPVASSNDSNEKHITLEETAYYKITQFNSMYYYYIYDMNNNIIKYDGPINKKPHIKLINENIIKISVQAGTGSGTRWGYYCNIENDKVSKIYNNIYDESNGKVAYGNENGIIVCDIFDNTKYFEEINCFNKPLSNMVNAIQNVTFENEYNIKISYFTGDNFIEVVETVQLPKKN